jgi:hypothetical protein
LVNWSGCGTSKIVYRVAGLTEFDVYLAALNRDTRTSPAVLT